jgi:hypothetical protein
MGAYTAFLDLTLGLASPVLGLLGGVAGLNAVFLASMVSVLCAAPIATRLLSARSNVTGTFGPRCRVIELL